MSEMMIKTKKLEEFLNLTLTTGSNEIEIVLDKSICESLGSKTKLKAKIIVIVASNEPEYGLLSYFSNFEGSGVIKYSGEIRDFKQSMLEYIKYNLEEVEQSCLVNSDDFTEIVTSIDSKSFKANKIHFKILEKSYFSTAATRLSFFAKSSPTHYFVKNGVWEEYDYLKIDNKIYKSLSESRLDAIDNKGHEVIRVDDKLFILKRIINEITLSNEFIDNFYFDNGSIYEEIYKDCQNSILCDAYSYDTGELTFYKKCFKNILFENFDSDSFEKLLHIKCGKDEVDFVTASLNGVDYVLQKVVCEYQLTDNDVCLFNENFIYKAIAPVDDFYFSLDCSKIEGYSFLGYSVKNIKPNYKVTKSINKFIDKIKENNHDIDFSYTIYNDNIFNKDFDCINGKKVSLIKELSTESQLVGVEGVISEHIHGSLYATVKYHGYFEVKTQLSNLKLLD